MKKLKRKKKTFSFFSLSFFPFPHPFFFLPFRTVTHKNAVAFGNQHHHN